MIFRSSVRLVPSSVADWLRAELESREIDAPLYARCLLSILQREDNYFCAGVIGDNLEDLFGVWDWFGQAGGPKRSLQGLGHTKNSNQFNLKSKDRSGRSRLKKNRGRRGTGEGGCRGSIPDEELFERRQFYNRSMMCDGDQLKKSAAIACLRTACDKKLEAEQLVEELWTKLRESDIIQNADSLESSPDRASEAAPELSDEGYRHAFPPLDETADAELRSSDVKWPTLVKKKEQGKPRVPFIFKTGAFKGDKKKTEDFVASDGYDGDISSRESSKDRRQIKNYYYDLKQGQKPVHSSSKFLPLFKSNSNLTEENACGSDFELLTASVDHIVDIQTLEESFMSLLKLQEVDPKLNEIEAKFTAAIANIWKNDDTLHIKAEVRAVKFPLNAAFSHDASLFTENPADVSLFTGIPIDVALFAGNPEDVSLFTGIPTDGALFTRNPEDVSLFTGNSADINGNAGEEVEKTRFDPPLDNFVSETPDFLREFLPEPQVMPPPGFENFAVYMDEVDSAPYGKSRFREFFAENENNMNFEREEPAHLNIFDVNAIEEEIVNNRNSRDDSELWQIEENGNSLKPSISSQSLMEESLAILNHSREESCFAEVTPTLFKTPSVSFEPITEPICVTNEPSAPSDLDANYQGLMELLSKSADDSTMVESCPDEVKGEEGECLLTSTRTHFVPIREDSCPESYQDRYEDGATFDVASTLDEVSYLRSQSGTLILPGEEYSRYMVYRESNLPAPIEKANTPDTAEIFPLKFKIKETEKFCQTDMEAPAALSSRCETPTEHLIHNLNFARLYDELFPQEAENEEYMLHRVWTSESVNDPWVQEDIANKEVEIENEAANDNEPNEDQDGEILLAEIWTALSGESDYDEDQGIGHSEENFDYSYDVHPDGANVWESAGPPEGYEAWSYGENLGDDMYEQGNWLPGYDGNYIPEEEGNWPPPNIPVEYLDDELFDEIFGILHANVGAAESEGGSKKTSSQTKKKKKAGEKWKSKRRRHGSYHRPCMYFVEGECRRADCQFSHDLGAIPCRFWLDGGCFKAESCPFRHGFASHHGSADHSEAERGFELESESDFPTLGLGAEVKVAAKSSDPRPIPKQKGGANASTLVGKKQKLRCRRFTAAEIIGSAASTSENATPHTSERRRKNKKKGSEDKSAPAAPARRRRAISEREVAPA